MGLLKIVDEKIFFPYRYRQLTKTLSPYLQNCGSVLDLGASCGRLARKIQDKLKGTRFAGVDVHVQGKTFMPVKKYDGRKLPFKSNSFDCVMIIDVLHHDKNPGRILREAKRVSRRYLLIKDHYWKTKKDFKILRYVDYIGNKPYGVALPYNFLKMESWRDLFKKNNLRIVTQKKFKFNRIDPVKQVIFKLRK
jgi:SAM-dependent methyltransferase